MSHIRVLICCVDDPDSDQMTELAAFDFPAADVSTLQPKTALDELDTSTHQTGNAILRQVLQAQWDSIHAELTERHRQQSLVQRKRRPSDRAGSRSRLTNKVSTPGTHRSLYLARGWPVAAGGVALPNALEPALPSRGAGG